MQYRHNMMSDSFKISNLYDEPESFFRLNGSARMKLTARTALEVCKICTENNIVIAYIEGGVYFNETFEARIDAIWRGFGIPFQHDTKYMNDRAALFIQNQSPTCNGFILTIMTRADSDHSGSYPHAVK